MPLRKQARKHFYTVHFTCYATQEIKDRVLRGELHISSPDQFSGELLYLGDSESKAKTKFYEASKKAMKDPLAYSVTVEKDHQTLIYFKVEH
jgi:hypothetical protein